MTKAPEPKPPRPQRAGPATPANPTTGSFQVSDELWAALAPLIPQWVNTHPLGGGPAPSARPDLRQWHRLRAAYRLPVEGVGRHGHLLRLHRSWRFQEWVAAGVFLELWRTGLERYDELPGLDWSWLSRDGALTKAPLGGGKTGPNPTDRGKSGVKRRRLTEAKGVPVGLAVDGANRHDPKLVRATVDSWPVPRRVPSPETLRVCAWKGYDFNEVRRTLDEFGFTAHLRSRGAAAQAVQKAAGFKARRWVVERTHSWMNRFRRILVRWDKSPANYIAFLHFACTLIALRAAGLLG